MGANQKLNSTMLNMFDQFYYISDNEKNMQAEIGWEYRCTCITTGRGCSLWKQRSCHACITRVEQQQGASERTNLCNQSIYTNNWFPSSDTHSMPTIGSIKFSIVSHLAPPLVFYWATLFSIGFPVSLPLGFPSFLPLGLPLFSIGPLRFAIGCPVVFLLGHPLFSIGLPVAS